MTCLDFNELTAFIEQKLNDEQREPINTHLASCPPCYEMVVELARFSGSQEVVADTALALFNITNSTFMMRKTGHAAGSDDVPLLSERLDGDIEGAHPVATKRTLAAGSMVDHFRIMRRLGHGGMGTVYLARDTKLGRKVALKLVNPDVLGSHDAVERFLFEARTTAKFNHPNIVTVYAVGQVDRTPYVALEYLEGQDLRQRANEERLSVHEALRIILAVTEAVQEAHRHGVLHRDLKPANVLLPKDGRVRVVDFGLAHHTGDRDRRSSTVQSVRIGPSAEAAILETDGKTIRGTPAYMAPEQWKGEGCSAATDIWAIGLLLYELCTGRLPYLPGKVHQNNSTSPIQSLIDGVCSDEPVPPIATSTELTEPVAAIIAQCLEKEPQNRASPASLIESLQDILFEGRRSLPDEESPFRGLLPFAERHADVFFGRNREISALVERLRHEPTLVIVGVSGAGKSSLVQAGLVPRLRQQGDWRILRLRPGQNATQRLARRLSTLREESQPTLNSSGSKPQLSLQSTTETASETASETKLYRTLCEQPEQLGNQLRQLTEGSGFKLLLVADQLEELFTLNDDADDRKHFLQAICGAADDIADDVRVVLTVRSDFLPKLAKEGPEVRRILEHVMVLHTPDEAARIEILTAPLESVGYRYDDPDLPSEMAREVDTDSGLPLLQFAARRLWDSRDQVNCTLRREVYEKMGGVTGALTQHADSLFATLSPDAILTARSLLLRLVTPERTRRAVHRSRLVAQLGEDAPLILDRLIKGRLLTVGTAGGQSADHAHIELAHEALITHWRQFSGWIEESHEERLFHEQLQQAADLWAERGRLKETLWQGGALRDAERHLKRSSSKPTPLMKEFIEASQQHDNRRVRRVRLTVALVLTFVSLVAFVLGIQKQQLSAKNIEAETHRRQAEQRAIEALVESAQGAYARGNPLEARAKLRQAFETDAQPSLTARSLWQQLLLEPTIWETRLNGIPYDIAASKDGHTIAVCGQSKLVYLLDPATGALKFLRGHRDQVLKVAMSPDGKLLASASTGGNVLLWQLPSGVLQKTISASKLRTAHLHFGPRGDWFVAGSNDGTLKFFDTATFQLTRTINQQTPIRGTALSPDGRLLAVVDQQYSLRIWDLKDDEVVYTDTVGKHGTQRLAFSPDGKHLALASNQLRLWDVGTWRSHHLGTPINYSSIAYSTDGRYLLTGTVLRESGKKAQLSLWDVKSRRLVRIVEQYESRIQAILFDNKKLGVIVAQVDGTIRRYRGPRHRADNRHHGLIARVRFDTPGKRLASIGGDAVLIWNVQSGALQAAYHTPGESPWGVAFSPDGKTLAVSTSAGRIHLWDAETGAKKRDLSAHDQGLAGTAFTPDGTTLAVGGYDSRIRLWDAASGTRQGEIETGLTGLETLSFSADGKLLLAASKLGGLELWDFERRVLVDEQNKHRGVFADLYGADLSSDGHHAVSGGKDSTLRLWNIKAKSGLHVSKLPGRVHGTMFHPSNQLVGAASSDTNAYFTTLDGRITKTLEGHRGEVNDIDFSPDGTYAATGSDDRTVRLWDSKTGRPYWRAPLLLSSPPRLLTHRGLQTIDKDKKLGAPRS